jgi:hypothetical protein
MVLLESEKAATPLRSFNVASNKGITSAMRRSAARSWADVALLAVLLLLDL